MNKKIGLIFGLQCFFLSASHAQVLKGKISAYNRKTVPQAIITIKDTLSRIGAFTFAKNGYYAVTLPKNHNRIVLEVKANGFVGTSIIIDNLQKEATYTNNFELQEDKVINLNEVSVIGKRTPVIEQEDTTTYQVSSFRNGSERKVEDLLKKLPGIQVNDKSGEIKYKGRVIETVQIEGDNLFGQNYKIGTKNINIDLVDQIQAIEHFSENKLLKGIENSDKVVLNLKLKKKQTDISGDLNVDNGVDSYRQLKYNNTSNILSIAQSFKAFINLTHNNIGQNNAPFDYWDYIASKQTSNNQEQFVDRTIADNEGASILDNERSNVNDLLLGGYSGIFKIRKNTSVKTNFYYINDKVQIERKLENSYFADNVYFTNTESFVSERKINLLRAELDVKINTSESSLLEYYFKGNYKQNYTHSLNDFNKTTLYNTSLNSTDRYFSNRLLFTKKFTPQTILQTELTQSFNGLPQAFNITPSGLDSAAFFDRQTVNATNYYFDCKATLLGKTPKLTYNFLLGLTRKRLLLGSQLDALGINQQPYLQIAQNEAAYHQEVVYSDNSVLFKISKWQIEPGVLLKYLSQRFYHSLDTQASDRFLFLPKVKLRFSISSASAISASMIYNSKPMLENYWYENRILNGYRNIKTNTPSLEVNQSYSATTNYNYADLRNQFWFSVGLSYNLNKGNYIAQNVIENKFIRTNFLFAPENTIQKMIFLSVEKFMPNLSTMVKFNTYYSQLNYKNTVNNSTLKDNINTTLESDVFIKTAFDGILNFENKVSINLTEVKSISNQSFSSILLNNSLKIILRPVKQIFILFSADYFAPNLTRSNQSYLFFDTNLRISTKNKKIDFFVKFKNLTNNSFFLQIDNTDFSQVKWQSNLMPGYGMLSVSYNL
jgi:hypothetical protein